MTKKHSSSDEQSPWLDADEIRTNVSVEDVLSGYGLLDSMKRKGKKLSGSSPFIEDKLNAFSADLERNIWNDFTGRPGQVPGNVIGLVQALEKCSFREALVILNRRFIENAICSTEQAEEEVSSESGAETKQREKRNIPFGRELKGRTHIPPLLERGITEETIKEFGIVYCTSGLMKGRIAFPIRDVAGEVMAYAGRAVKEADEKQNGKYRFPPNFSKSLELFNIDRVANDRETKKAVKNFGIVLVKGFTDVLKLHQEGFPNAIALMGNEMSEAQRSMLLDPVLNPTRRVTLFLNNTDTGQRWKRAIARDLIYGGFVRYVDWSYVSTEKTEPEHFTREEFTVLLGHRG